MASGGSAQDDGYRHVACCVADIGSADRAVAEASRVARLSGARLSLVHVVETPAAFSGGRSVWSPPERRVAAELVEEARAELAPAAAEVDHAEAVVLQSNDPPIEVIRWARREGCDLLVAGPRRRPGVADMILGSFAARLVRHAGCPVLLVLPAPPGPGVDRG
jgi:nucleotide-binding universal stress UspA family protein